MRKARVCTVVHGASDSPPAFRISGVRQRTDSLEVGVHRLRSLPHKQMKASIPMTYQSVNPYNGKSSKPYREFNDLELEHAIAQAHANYGSWKALRYADRAHIVAKAAAILHARIDEYAQLITVEMGKLIGEARGEVQYSADILAYYAKNAAHFLAPQELHPQHGEAHMESSPIGVIFGVEPWNFPYYQLARVAGPQLMAGNVVMVKHAACVPQCAIAFEKLWIEAGAPPGTYTNLLISHAQSDRVIEDPRIKGVALTGSVAAGRDIAARAGRNLKISSMELGGSDAFIVLEDADLEKTIPWAVWGRMYNQGQTCCAAKRFIVLDSIADDFLTRFKAALSRLHVGNPLDETTTKGPLSTEQALIDLLAQVDGAVAHGAVVLMGGKRIERVGSFMETTILGDVKPDNPAYRDEFFGPVALFFRVANEEEAIALANDSDFGLGGSVFTRDIERGKRIASRIDTGMMFINNIDWSDAELPFGGIKNSGYGRELGDMGIQEFVNKKLVRTIDSLAPA
jgi:succinate-semialdehyde dehydrogenase/glutarate-semialdehyde dehydrogenase